MTTNEIYRRLGVSEAVLAFGEGILAALQDRFAEIDRNAEINQAKVLAAMQKNRVNAANFAATTGYGYDDEGRDNLERVYADTFRTEAALVRPQITCGTHALAVALSANLLPGDELLAVSGKPYDTLEEVIGIRESRRFHGIDTLTEDDLLNGVIGDTTIGLGSYIIDIHDGNGAGTIVKKVKPYGIPYGSTVSSDIANLMFAGRCGSMDAVAMSSLRVMPPLMAMGQAAGVGAALAVEKGVDPGQVNVAEVRSILRADGVMLETSPDAADKYPNE